MNAADARQLLEGTGYRVSSIDTEPEVDPCLVFGVATEGPILESSWYSGFHIRNIRLFTRGDVVVSAVSGDNKRVVAPIPDSNCPGLLL